LTVVARQLGWYAAWLDTLIEQGDPGSPLLERDGPGSSALTGS
jgi:hypothetical protein